MMQNNISDYEELASLVLFSLQYFHEHINSHQTQDDDAYSNKSQISY